MSYDPHAPPARGHYPPAGFRPRQSNGLGVAGLIVSILALFMTCGLLSPVGLLLSLMGLFKRPRGEAIAGVVLGGIGTLFVLSVVGLFVMASMTAVHTARHAHEQQQTQAAIQAATADVERFRAEQGEQPAGIEGNKIVLQHVDGWGTPLRYEPDDHIYRIRSAGPDRQFDTADDALAGRTLGGNFDSEADAFEVPEIEVPEIEMPEFQEFEIELD